jgi:LAO/AO transport system kinase
VVQLSALQGQGVDAFWQQVSRFRQLQTDNGRFAAKRQRQAQSWMWERIEAGLRQRFREHPAVKAQLNITTDQVLHGLLPASTAARQLLELFH